jgi:hypothetical protein
MRVDDPQQILNAHVRGPEARWPDVSSARKGWIGEEDSNTRSAAPEKYKAGRLCDHNLSE